MVVRMQELEPIQSQDPPRSKRGNGVKFESYRWGVDTAFMRSLQGRAAEVYERVFRLGVIQTADEIYHQMQRDPSYRRSITFATLGGRDVGFLIQGLEEIPVRDERKVRKVPVLVNASRAVEIKHQDKHIGTTLLIKGNEEHSQDHPLYNAGRTQVEPIIASLQASDLFDEIMSLDRKFRSVERQIVRYLAGNVFFYRMASVKLDTGLVENAYPEGEAGGYTLDLSRPRIQRIHAWFQDIGVINEDGHKEGRAAIYLARNK